MVVGEGLSQEDGHASVLIDEQQGQIGTLEHFFESPEFFRLKKALGDLNRPRSLDALRIEIHEGLLLLSGKVPTFYVRQLVIEKAKNVGLPISDTMKVA